MDEYIFCHMCLAYAMACNEKDYILDLVLTMDKCSFVTEDYLTSLIQPPSRLEAPSIQSIEYPYKYDMVRVTFTRSQ